MKWSNLQFTQSTIGTEWLQVCLLLLLTTIFSFNTIGFLEFSGDGLPGVSFNPDVFYLRNNQFRVPTAALSLDYFLMGVSGLTLAFLLPILKPYAASVLVMLMALPSLYLGINMPLRDSAVPMQYSLLVLLMLYGTNVLISYLGETRRKQKLVNVFGLYVPPEIVRQMSRQSESLELGGESRNLTVLFGDLISFSSVSEQLSPKDLVHMLNEYFTVMTTILYKYGATIDKYIGDSIMAFWGAPLSQEDHARRAVLAAFEMHREIGKLSADFIKKGWPGPTMGIGINSGMMNVGNMGSRYRLAYTVIGDAVNLSARLQTMTRIYKVPSIVGEQTAATVNEVVFRELDVLNVKGKKVRSRIYQPFCKSSELTDQKRDFLARHQKALDLYYSDKLDEATEKFQALINEADDPRYYQYMIEKISHPAD